MFIFIQIVIQIFLIGQFFCKNEIILEHNYNNSSSICVLEIAKKYFDKSSKINIFLSNYSDNEDLLFFYNTTFIKKIMNFTNFNIDFKDERRNYAIIVVESLEKLLLYEKQIKKLNTWNSRAKYLFIIKSNNFTKLENVVSKLWAYFIINAVIMIPSTNIPEEINLYSWFPYEKESCGENIKEKLIDICKYGKFNYNRNLYPLKIPKKFNGCPVRALVIIWVPFVMKPDDGIIEEGKALNISKGLDVFLMKTVSEILNITLLFYSSIIPHNWGLATYDGNTTGAIKSLIEKKYDISFGAFGPMEERRMLLDYVDASLFESVTFCVPKAQHIPKWQNIIVIFQSDVWILIFIIYITVTVFMFCLCVSYPKDKNSFISVQNNFQYFFSLFLCIAIKRTPNKLSGRILIFGWIIFGFYFVSVYQAKLIGVLLHPPFDKQINTIEELLTSDLKFFGLPTLKRFFRNTNDQQVRRLLEKWILCHNANSCLKNIALKRDSALCILQHHAKFTIFKYTDNNLDPLIHCFPNYLTFPTEIYMIKGFPLRDDIGNITQWIKSSGLLIKWSNDLKSFYKRKKLHKNENKKNEKLTMLHLNGAFVILVTGIIISSICFTCEIVYFKIFNEYYIK